MIVQAAGLFLQVTDFLCLACAVLLAIGVVAMTGGGDERAPVLAGGPPVVVALGGLPTAAVFLLGEVFTQAIFAFSASIRISV